MPTPPLLRARVGQVLGPEWFARDAHDVARDLLGAHLTVDGPEGAVTVRLTEVEVYGGAEDPGSHAHRGKTARNASMFGPGGHVYVYFTYGMHWCANLVTGQAEQGQAVLLRAGEVTEGLELARRRRPAAKRDAELASGPARLASALGLAGGHDGLRLLGPADAASASSLSSAVSASTSGAKAVTVALRAGEPANATECGPRTGVRGPGGSAENFPWRYWISGDATVSRYRPAVARKRRAAPAA